VLQSVAETRKIAQAFVEARQGGQSLSEYPGPLPENLDQAYAVQDSALTLFGDQVAGWKVGRINPPWLDKLGVSRLAGPIFECNIAMIEGNAPSLGNIFDGGFGAVEAEYIFRVGQDAKQGQSFFTANEAADLIDAVFCGFEIASSPFAGINTSGPLVTISDFGNNNGLLVGPEIPDWRSKDLDSWHVETMIDGAVIGTGMASAFPGGLLESVRFLLENLVQRGIEITPGILISTGAVTGVHEVKAGQHVEACFGDQIRIACDIEIASSPK
jgi:2-keto-4-pentenoate hydratase